MKSARLSISLRSLQSCLGLGLLALTHFGCGPAVLAGAGIGVLAAEGGSGKRNGSSGSTVQQPTPQGPRPTPTPPPSLPNLVALNVKVSSRSVSRGESFDLSYEVANRGTALAGSFEVRVAISNSPTLSQGSERVTLAFTIPSSLGPGETYRRELRRALGPYGSGTYFLVLKVDGRQSVQETNEDDNVRAFGTFTIE